MLLTLKCHKKTVLSLPLEGDAEILNPLEPNQVFLQNSLLSPVLLLLHAAEISRQIKPGNRLMLNSASICILVALIFVNINIITTKEFHRIFSEILHDLKLKFLIFIRKNQQKRHFHMNLLNKT